MSPEGFQRKTFMGIAKAGLFYGPDALPVAQSTVSDQ